MGERPSGTATGEFQLSFLFLLFLAHLFPALSYTGLEPRRSSLRPGELEVWGVAL